MRNISFFEKSLIEGVARRLPSVDASVLVNDLARASAEDSFADRAKVAFIIEGYDRPAYGGQHRYPVEIRLVDADKSDLTAVLYADENNRLFELEIIRWDGGGVIAPSLDSILFY